MCSAKRHVRFTPNSDIDCVFWHVCFGPKADIGYSITSSARATTARVALGRAPQRIQQI
jgi:hypothetical protein